MAGVAVNVLDPEFYVDPWEAYRWLRDEAPVYWDPVQGLWVLSRYDDVWDAERDTGRYSSAAGSRPLVDQSTDLSMINLDDPDHHRQRRLVVPRFTPRAVRGHEERVRAVVTQLLDAVAPLGECEAIEAIASRLPAIMIGDLLGFPRELWERVRYWSEQTMLLSGQTSPLGPPHVMNPAIVPVIVEFAEVTAGLIQARRARPEDDLISAWAGAGWDDKRILDEAILVLDGGAETTRTVIGSMIVELARQPSQRRLLAGRPELLAGTAVEEFIRWVSPLSNMRRTATRDHVRGGQRIRAGDQVVLLYGAANRDPRAFDEPDVLDVTRPRNRHLAFGAGTHLCLGAHLARLEIRVLFEELLRRMPDWELAGSAEPAIVPSTFARAYDQARISWGHPAAL